MRLRNLKNKDEIMDNSKYFIKNPQENKGNWKNIFGNDNPIYIEIGMGKGKFIIENALKYPNINFIGVEKFDKVLARSLIKIPEGLNNLLIIRADAINISDIFSHEIDKIYLNFSDPWPKSRHESRRLTSENFLCKYDEIFKEDEIELCFRTDNRDLYIYSLMSFSKHGYILESISFDLHSDNLLGESIITTEYEDKFSSDGLPIYYVVAKGKVSR